MTNGSTVSVWIRVFAAGLLLIACAAMGQPTTRAKAVPAAPSTPGADVPRDWWATVQKEIAQSEYNVTWQDHSSIPELGAAWQAPNRAQDLRTYFTTGGPRVIRRTAGAGSWTWGLEIAGCGSAEECAALSGARDVCAEGNRIVFEREGLDEWYVNTEAGLEQGFTVYQAPALGGAITVRMAVRGDLSADMMPDGQTVEFLTAGGVAVMHYGKLHAADAQGRVLPTTISLDGETIELRVDAKDAVFPVTIDPLASAAAWTAESNQIDAWFGWSVATAGDVNGDGYSDVIVGAPGYDNGQTDEGRAFVYYGSAAGLSATANWTAESDQATAYFGWAAATAGDVNGDGYSDVIVSALYYDNGQTNEGRVYAYYGSASGLPSTASWTAESNQANSDFGVSISTAGDVNGDGYSDILVGADTYDNGQTNEGRVYCYHGSASGLPKAENWTAESDQADASFGASVATAGDVNGDGYADVIIGAPLYDNTLADEGRVTVYPGSATGLSGTPLRTIYGGQAGAYLGCSVSTAGDLNGDGYSDVIIGAYGYDNGETDEGRAYVYGGSSSGLSVKPVWTVEGNQAGANLGWSVATAGDVNGDGYADVIVSAPAYDNGETDEGRVLVYYGSSSGMSTTAGWTAESNQIGAKFGYAVFTAGDVNGDGYADVIVGAPFYDNGQTDEGRAFVYYGSASTLSATAAWTAESNQVDAWFGWSVSTAGDVNGDGYADVIVGAPHFDNGQTDSGIAFVYHGSASGLSTTANWQATVGTNFGWSVATAGDVNGDGYSDVIIGGRKSRGEAFVFYGSASGLSSTADWTKDSDGLGSAFGYSVSGAGDVNGDGYADVIIGDYLYTDGQSQEGAAFVFYGSASGLSSSYGWRVEGNQAIAKLGWSVSTAGDVNGDGYADVIVGVTGYDNTLTDEGAVFIYYGSASGLSASPSWSAYGGVANTIYGEYVSAAGDVNGDGFADVIVGASHSKVSGSEMGLVNVWYGSASGMQATPWSVRSDQAGSRFGVAVATAGDVNGDGYSDIIVGAPGYDNGQTDEGRVFVYFGSASGPSATANWTAESNQASASFGWTVATAGDVNGDGYADVIVGAPLYDNGETDEGWAGVYYGNDEAGRGMSLNPRQRRGDDTVAVAPLGLMPRDSAHLAAKGRTPFGRSKAKLECELKAFRTAFDGTGTVKTTSWTNTGVGGASFNQAITGLSNGGYHWRMRLLYSPAITPFQQHSRWFAMPWDGWQQEDFRLIYQPPTPPSNPGAKGFTTSSITWTWTDNSDNETGFKVWVGSGTETPTLLFKTTAAGVTSVTMGAASPSINRQYCFQVAATGTGGDSAKTVLYSAWTLANTPTVPTVGTPTTTTLNVAIGSGDDNPSTTEYAVRCTTTNTWVQANGALGASAVYQTVSAWGSIAVSGLAADTSYAFAVTARNGAATSTAEGPAAAAFTLTVIPNVAGMVEANAESAITDADLTVGLVMEVYSSSVPAGMVLLQSPDAGTAEPVGTAVNITVSLGPAPVTVPNVAGMTESAAGAALASAHLAKGAVTQQCSNTVALGLVISQTPASGGTAPYGSAVALVVSTGPCPVTVPNVVGQTQAAAGTALTGAYLTTGTVTQQCSNTIASGLVISQTPASGGTAPYGSAVALVVSTGMCPVTVPNVVGLTEAAATTALFGAHLTPGGMSVQRCSNTVAAGLVISQDPPSGQSIPYGNPVTLVVSTGGCPVTVPNVVGQTQAAAGTALTGANLTTGTVTQQCSNTVASGLVISQTPASGQSAAYGSAVALVISTGPCNVTVPNVVGLTQTAAGTALIGANLIVGTVTQQHSSTVASGLVISQTPSAGEQTPYGGAVALIVSQGPPPPMTGSIVINGNRSATNNPVVTLTLTWAGGDGTGVVRMRFSNDGSTWTAWQSLQAAPSYTLPSGDGHKTVRVQYIDKMNNKSAVFSDYILLDTTLPTGSIIINNGAATTTTQSVTLGLTWADSGALVSRMRFSDDGAHWTAWTPPTATRAYTLPAGLGNHTVRVQYLDGANNYSLVYNDYIKIVAP